MSAIPTSITIQSSIALRLRALAPRIHGLGVRPFFEAMCSIVGGADPMATFERYGEIAIYGDVIEAFGGSDLSPNLRVIK